MNAKKVKQLRRLSERMTVGAQDRQLVWDSSTGRTVDFDRATNSPGTTRGSYRALKKEARRRGIG